MASTRPTTPQRSDLLLLVEVAPSVGPFVPDWITTLWESGELFVKLMVTLPALAASDVVLYLS